jgi:digeranylgeranylglycerophospholipid reductase
MHDAIVIGAGPAGLLAARRLALRGLDVVVLEEHASIGDPVHCTGILAREAFREFGLSSAAVLNELTTARFLSPAGHQFVHRTRGVEAVVVDRAAFDARLADDARQAGARIVRDARVTDISRDAGGVSVGVARQAARRARACVLACSA